MDLKEGYPWRACGRGKKKVLCCCAVGILILYYVCGLCGMDGRIQNLQRNLVQGTTAIYHPWIMKSREQERSKFHTHTKEKRNGSDRNIILGSSPSTLEIGLYLSPEYRYVNSEIRPHYLFFWFLFFPSFYLGPAPLRLHEVGRRRERVCLRGFVSLTSCDKTLKSHKKDYNGMEACNIYKIQGYFYTIGMNNLTTNNTPPDTASSPQSPVRRSSTSQQ